MIDAPWHKHGAHVYAPMAGADGALNLDDERAIDVRDGALRLVRNARPYGAPDANTLIDLPMDDGSTAGSFLDDAGAGAPTMAITINAGADNWRVIDGTPAFIPTYARRGKATSFNFGAGNSWTIDLLVYPFSEKTATAHQTLVSYDHATHRFSIFWSAQTRRLRVDLYGANGSLNFTTADVLNPGRWHHLRLSIAPSSTILSIDGVERGSSAANHGFAGGVTGNLEVGYGSWQAFYTHAAALASLRISNTVRSGGEIVPLFSVAPLAARPQTALALSDLDRFRGFESAFLDAVIASGTGAVKLYAQTDAAAPVLLGSAAGTGRTIFSGALVESLSAAQSFTLYPTLQAADARTPGPRVTGFGFSYRTPEVALGSSGAFGEFQRLVAADLESVFAFSVATPAQAPLAVRPSAVRHARLQPGSLTLKRRWGEALEQEFRLTLELLLIGHRPEDAHEAAHALAGDLSAHFSRVRYALPGAIFRSLNVVAAAPRWSSESPGGWAWRVELSALVLITAP